MQNISRVDTHKSISYRDITHVCMTPSLYALLQYLLLFDYDTVAHHTFYFTGYAVSEDIASRLPGKWISIEQTAGKKSVLRVIKKWHLHLVSRFRYPFIQKAQIFAFDVGFVSSLIGNRPYALLSDGPLGITQNMQSNSAEYLRQQKKKQSLQGRIEEFLYGPVAVCGWGNNSQCQAFYLTEKNDAIVFQDKPLYIASLQQLWKNASPELKEYVKYVFDVTKEDVQILSSKKVMFLTQPMVKDGILTEEEYLEVLNTIFSHYDQSQLLLKLHPRDNFDYKTHFPQVTVYEKKVNMQLLVLLGTNVERAVTICSSSINSFPESVEADWFGVDLHPKLKAWFGEMVPPFRQYNQM